MDYPKEYPRMLAVAAVVVNDAGQILLHRRDNDPDKGKWQIFGTYVKPAERLVDAVKRRIKENAGIDSVQTIEFTGKYYDVPGRHVGSYCVPFAFKITVAAGTKVNLDSCAWFSAEEAKNLDLALDNHQIVAEVS